jgi:hypothetical protein
MSNTVIRNTDHTAAPERYVRLTGVDINLNRVEVELPARFGGPGWGSDPAVNCWVLLAAMPRELDRIGFTLAGDTVEVSDDLLVPIVRAINLPDGVEVS